MRKISFTFILFLVVFNVSFSQVKLYKEISNPNNYSLNEEKLLLVEFWATWCVPCLGASRQLQYTQQYYTNNLHVISVSKENEDVVLKYIQKNSPQLAIALDFESNTFETLNEKGIVPFSVLINQNNQIVWKGNPLSLTDELIQKYIDSNKNTSRLPINQRLSFDDSEKEIETATNLFGIELSKDEESNYIKDDFTFYYSGPISDLLMELLSLSPNQLKLNKDFSVSAQISNHYLNCPQDSILLLLKNIIPFELSLTANEMEGFLLEVETDEAFWDTDQINWGYSTNMYLKEDLNYKINNATLAQLSFHLSKILMKPVVLKNTENFDNKLYDWQLAYKYEELLFLDLKQTFGITLQKTFGEIPVFNINIY